MITRAVVILLAVLSVKSFSYQSLNLTKMNYDLEQLNFDPDANLQILLNQNVIDELTHEEMGEYLLILAKFYLYGIQPQSQQFASYQSQARYVLAYHYLKTAAQIYENSDAYYYLALLEYVKFVPTTIIRKNLQLLNNYEMSDLIADMESHHLHNIEHNLYLASLFGHNAARLSLASMFKDGVGTQKNCSSALAYYLLVVKETRVDTFQFPSDYKDMSNFQYELYSHKKVDLKNYGEFDASALTDTLIFDQQTMKAYEEVAMNYLTGENGFMSDQGKAAKMLEKMQEQSGLSRMMLGFLYLKGRGVEKNFHKARMLFEKQPKSNRVAEQTLLVMKYMGMGYENERVNAVNKIQEKVNAYEQRQLLDRNQTESIKNNPMVKSFRTPLIKYITGSLILGGHVNGKKETGIQLLESAAKEGHTLAMIQMGLLFVDGTDINFDCRRAIEYFSKQALSHKMFQQRIELAKIGIKNKYFMFSFIKYIQLMLVGYNNSFVNAMYLLEVYKQEVFKFTENSWSTAVAKKNALYKYLLKSKRIHAVDEEIAEQLNPIGQNLIEGNQIDELTQVKNTQLLAEYENYAKLKITTIGVMKHDISILRFFKYKSTKDINILHKLAKTIGNSPHLLQSRFLLGRYYHHTPMNSTTVENRQRRALEEYTRATKNKILAEIIFYIEGGEIPEVGRIFNHLIWYLTAILGASIILYYVKNKRMEEIFRRQNLGQHSQQEEEAIEENMYGRTHEWENKVRFSEEEQEAIMNPMPTVMEEQEEVLERSREQRSV